MKINLEKPETYLADLRDDILVNKNLPLYDFVGEDIEKCYFTGFLLPELLKDLPLEKYYLYSKPFRHIQDNLEKYSDQLIYWQEKYYEEHDEKNMVKVLNYVLNNFFFENERDRIDMALYLGKYSYFKQHKDDQIQDNDKLPGYVRDKFELY